MPQVPFSLPRSSVSFFPFTAQLILRFDFPLCSAEDYLFVGFLFLIFSLWRSLLAIFDHFFRLFSNFDASRPGYPSEEDRTCLLLSRIPQMCDCMYGPLCVGLIDDYFEYCVSNLSGFIMYVASFTMCSLSLAPCVDSGKEDFRCTPAPTFPPFLAVG